MSTLKSTLKTPSPLPLIDPESISFEQGSFLLGEGSFGTVKRGVFEGKTVAVKVVFPRKKRHDANIRKEGNNYNDDDAQYRKMVRLLGNEARAMNEVRHPRIISLLGFIEQEASLVMEFMECGSLCNFIYKTSEIHWNQRFIFMADIVEGMAFLHSKVNAATGTKKPVLFHQDLKSDNVLLSFENSILRAKISDFGLASKVIVVVLVSKIIN
jgi:serine/threonine protein kinase